MTEPPAIGSIVDYPYLWRRERDAGETERRKVRPACLVVSVTGASGEHLIGLVPITSQRPVGVRAIEVPQLELARAGLSHERRAWVIVSELNTDVLERSWYGLPSEPRGAFGPKFLDRVLAGVERAPLQGGRRHRPPGLTG